MELALGRSQKKEVEVRGGEALGGERGAFGRAAVILENERNRRGEELLEK